MEIVALVLGGILLVGVAAYVNRDTPARQERARWALAAKNLGLTGDPGKLAGRLEGVDLEVRIVDGDTARPSIEAVATPDQETRVSLRQWREGRSRDGAVRTGDKAFDKVWVVRGDAPMVRAALGPKVRETLLAFAAARELEVTRGAVQMKVLGATTELARIQEVARQTASLAAALSVSEEQIVERLAANLAAEPSAKARKHCLSLLIAHHPDAPETKASIQQALSDPSAHVRVTAALEAGKEGIPALEEALADPDAPFQLRDQAAFQLSKTAPVPRVEELLRPYLVDGHPMRAAAVESMIARGADPGLAPLMTMLRSNDPDEICVGARCVGAHGYKQAEVTLVQLVSHDDKKVQVGVVHALGQVGTKRALGVLKKRSTDPTAGARLKRAAKEAVRRIEARATVSG